MAVTGWEHRKAISNRLRAIWDAERGADSTWEQSFARAKAALVSRLNSDADIAAGMTWGEFQRLQGWRDQVEREARR